LTIAYQASFLREEGRVVRACLYAKPTSYLYADDENNAHDHLNIVKIFRESVRERQDGGPNCFSFSSPFVLDDPKHIARFAPTLVADDAVLVVGEEKGRVHCAGITLLDREDTENDLLSMPHGWHGVGGLFVRILNPG